MFASPAHLKRRTPAEGIGRKEYIEHLVEEYHTTTDIEAQEQVTANLANFAYDPINYTFLRDAEAVDLFLQILNTPNDRLALHGIAGICNICLDQEVRLMIATERNFKLISDLFIATENPEIILNCITLFYLLLSDVKDNNVEMKSLVCRPEIIRKINTCKLESTDIRIKNISSVFVQDFATRRAEVNVEPK